jgi:hypothetical protein
VPCWSLGLRFAILAKKQLGFAQMMAKPWATVQ